MNYLRSFHSLAAVCLALIDTFCAVAVSAGPPAGDDTFTKAKLSVSAGAAREVTLEADGRLGSRVVLSNTTDRPVVAEMEFLIQQDPVLFNWTPPDPLYGADIAPGKKSWIVSDGAVHQDNSLTDGKLWTEFGAAWHNDNNNKEAFGYVDLGSSVRITHLGYQGGDANWIWKVDFAASLDGKDYTPIAGLQGLDFYHKWGPQEVNVPKPFEARFLRMASAPRRPGSPGVSLPVRAPRVCQRDGGNLGLPQDRGYAPCRQADADGSGQGYRCRRDRRWPPTRSRRYLVAVRTKAAGLTQMTYQHLLVMPPAMAKITRRPALD